jgi:hypothetical protein
MLWIIVVVLLVLLIAGLPTWPYSSGLGYGYGPSGIVGAILLVLLILLLFGYRW